MLKLIGNTALCVIIGTPIFILGAAIISALVPACSTAIDAYQWVGSKSYLSATQQQAMLKRDPFAGTGLPIKGSTYRFDETKSNAQINFIMSEIDRIGKEEGVDPLLIRAFVWHESRFNPNAKSHKGAMGLMQLMPQTATLMNVKKPYDVSDNLRGGIKYFKSLLKQYKGNYRLAVAAYYTGPTNIAQNGGRAPSYTQSYVNSVMRRYHRYK